MKNFYLSILGFFIFTLTFSQEGVSFKENKKLYLHGNSVLIGNNILGHHASKPLMDTNISNDEVNMKYIDVDYNPATFSSSEANIIDIPANAKIAHAELYWYGLYPFEKSGLRKSGNQLIHVGQGKRDSIVNSILFKTPTGEYESLNGEVILDSHKTGNFKANSPYACYADVTTKLQNLSNPNGAYTVANIKATEGKILGGGSAGWLLYVVYEDMEESPKYFTIFNGLLEVNKNPVEINFKDFKSKEEGDSKTTIALAAMEGDRNIKTDKVSIFDKKSKRFKALSNKHRKEKNFFNSSITIGDQLFTARKPNSANTLGFDLLKMEIPNPNNEVLENTTTQVKLKFETRKDRYYLFFVAFETEINQDFLEEKFKEEQDVVEIIKPITVVSSTVEKPLERKDPVIEEESKLLEITKEDELLKDLDIQSMTVPNLEPGYYLVTNVFSKAVNAVKWSQFLTEKKYTAKDFVNPENNWNYVYITNSKTLETVYEKWIQYKEIEYFKNIWIIGINL